MRKIQFFIILFLLGQTACGPSAEEQINRARVLMQSGNFSNAKLLLDQVIEKEAENQAAYNMRGIIKLELGEAADAIQDFDISVSLDSMDYRAFYNRGNALYQMEKYNEAILDYDKALRLAPKSSDIYINRGNALVGLEKYDQAIHDFGFAVKIDNENYLSHFNLARTYYLMDNLQLAENSFKNCLKVYGSYAPAYYFLGMIAMENSDKEAMCLFFEQASDLGYQQAKEVYNIYCGQN